MPSQKFTGRASEMKKSDWLAVEDIEDIAPVSMTIKCVYLHHNVEFEKGRKEPKVYSLAFESAHKQLVLNASNRKVLQKAFGNDAKKWTGKPVSLTVQPLPREFQGHTHGIRIQPTESPASIRRTVEAEYKSKTDPGSPSR